MKTMKKMFAMAFVAVVGLAGCQQELVDPDAVESDALKVYATIEDAEDTKTYLNDKEVYWSSGDRIAVFMRNSLRKRFEVSSESVGSKEGVFVYDSDYIVTGKSEAISNNVAYYPFSEVTCTFSGSTYTLSNVTIPTTQDYAPASFGQGSFPMVAVTSDTDDLDFAFKNLCGVLALQLKGSGTIRSIAVKGNSDEILSGKATVTAAYGKIPEISLLADGSKTVTLDCGETGVALQNDTPTSFYIVLPPVAFDNGFTVTVTDASGATKEYSTTKKNVIHRSGILRMPEQEYVGERIPQEGDYIDEYGINHGQGVEIDGVVWAPVNCGYHATDYAYGKLYQWGRKYGQGYDGSLIDVNGNDIGTYSDAVVPTIVSGPVDWATGQSQANEDNFYDKNSSPYDWLSPQNDELWNSGTEENPVKTEYDPCPEGWRVPTVAELNELYQNFSSWTSEGGQPGYWFSGASSYTENVPQVFFPAAGFCRGYDDGDADYRGSIGVYWSSSPEAYSTYYAYGSFFFNSVGTYLPAPYLLSDYRVNGNSVRCVQDDARLIPVENIVLNKSTLTLSLGASEKLSGTITPSNANHQSAHWWSDDPEVATVDQCGNVTAVSKGTTSIHAMAGMQLATCEVTVDAADYIDEYGVNHGSGVKIGETVWAPVNCGYHATDFKYGKLYQWGRKYGQGYEGGLYDSNWNKIGDYSDACILERVAGPVSLSTAQSKDNENNFYYNSSDPFDWCTPQNDKLWNSGTEENPVKTEFDPCPEGWRVPTYAELDNLNTNSFWTTVGDQKGRYFCGDYTYLDNAPQVFFSAAGHNDYDGTARNRGDYGYYWSSLPAGTIASDLYFNSSHVSMYYGLRTLGYSVRCVQDDSMLIPVESITLNKTSLSLVVGFSETLSSNISPSNANHKYTHWWSDNPEVAIVDQGGNVTAVASGTATVYAMAGMQVATCEVTVKDAAPYIDYIDEYGINHGVGVRINETVWAPVNCGYHKDDFKYGKLYQWGRKYGQGYSEEYDAIGPTVLQGLAVSVTEGNRKSNENCFYAGVSDWTYSGDDKLWNKGTEAAPIKTGYDPCPDGWRVPTLEELKYLCQNYSSLTTDDEGVFGVYFSGTASYEPSLSMVFLPVAGCLELYTVELAAGRGTSGYYWSSSAATTYGAGLIAFGGGFSSYYESFDRAYGFSVRCVQVTD